MFNPDDYEIFRKPEYIKFENNGKTYNLNKYPYLDIVFNDHCNFKCKFCISHLVHKKIKADINKLKKKIKYAIDNMGVKEVLLLGGEPTINDDIFIILDYLKQFNLNKICITTNGYRISKDINYAYKLIRSGITHINLSLMSLDKDKQSWISGNKHYFGIDSLKTFKEVCNYRNVMLRVNNNVFINNHDNLQDIISFYEKVSPYCDSVKFSPLLKTDTFSTVNEVTEFNRNHILSDTTYDYLWNDIENHYVGYPIVRNKETFGFVEYSMILLKTPIILNYNQHGKLRKKVIENKQINNIKLLPTGELSLSWNRDERDYFIRCPEE